MFLDFVKIPFFDTNNKKSSIGLNYNSLDGLRGLAALLVLTDHIKVLGNVDRGYVGVFVFFILSGFLLAQNLKKNDTISLSYAKNFYIRRLLRIYPLFFIIIVLQSTFLEGVIAGALPEMSHFTKLKFVLGQLFFLHSGGHFWAIAEEVYFYILLPVIFIFCYKLFRKRYVIILFLFGLSVALKFLRTSMLIGLPHNILLPYAKTKLPVYLDLFTIGVVTSFLVDYIFLKMNTISIGKRCINFLRILISFISIVILLFLFFANNTNVGLFANIVNIIQRFHDPYTLGWIISFLVLCLLVYPDGIVAKFCKLTVFRLIGVISYSVYLIHPHVLAYCSIHNIALPQNDLLRFMFVFCLTVVISFITYTYIERPFTKIKLKK